MFVQEREFSHNQKSIDMNVLTSENAETVATIQNIKHPEWGVKKFNYQAQPLNDSPPAHTFGQGSDSAVLDPAEMGNWEIVSLKEPTDQQKYRTQELFTFKVWDEDHYGFDIIHGIQRHTQDGQDQFFISDPEKFIPAAALDAELKKPARRVELIGSTDVDNSDEVIKALWMEKNEPFYTVYKRVQEYGGAEEGGWYYHTKEAKRTITEAESIAFEDTRDNHGEGEMLEVELIFGQHQDMERQHYC
jgi:hypothetical protein